MSQLVELKNLVESKTNPRGKIEKKDVEELAASIKQSGQLVPLLVRPKMGGKRGTDIEAFEIVAGHRRFAAAKLVGLQSLDCVVRDMTDDEVRAAQLVENLQRKDLHPMDEARGFVELLSVHVKDKPVLTPEDAAKRVGKPVNYVKRAIQLTKLVLPAQELFRDGKIGHEVAFAIARISSEADQLQAVKDIKGTLTQGWNNSVKDHLRLIGEYEHSLSHPPFDVTDEKLYPAAGSCLKCPKRKGNQAALFNEMELKDGDRCLDGSCFRKKTELRIAQLEVEYKKKGMKVVRKYDNRLVDLDDNVYSLKGHPEWSKVLKGLDFEKIAYIQDDGDVSIHVDPKTAIAALRAAGKKEIVSAILKGEDVDMASRQVESKRDDKLELVTLQTVIRSMHLKAFKLKDPVRIFCDAIASYCSEDTARMIGKALGWSKEDYKGKMKDLKMISWSDVFEFKYEAIKVADARQALAFLVCALGWRYPSGLSDEATEKHMAILGVKEKEIRANCKKILDLERKAKEQLAKERAAKKAEAAKKKPKAKTKAKAKKGKKK